jgi:hypothetical protein
MPASIPGVASFHALTLGDPRVRIAVIDGPFDRSHVSLQSAIVDVPTHFRMSCKPGPACRHGTAIMSLIFGQPGSTVEGIAPRCRGLNLPALRDLAVATPRFTSPGCSQPELAFAIDQAMAWNASIINISAGQYDPTGAPHPMLLRSIKRAIDAGALLIAAAGNDGCACLHVPASVAGVLVVGAHDAGGQPLALSNDPPEYHERGLLALGSDLLAAGEADHALAITGTSAATAVVSGLAGLVLSLGYRLGFALSNHELKTLMLDSCVPVAEDLEHDRAGMGRLDLLRLFNRLGRGKVRVMPDLEIGDPSHPKPQQAESPSVAKPLMHQTHPRIAASDCGCAECAAKRAANQPPESAFVFALGQLGYDCLTEARRDSLAQHMAPLSESLGQPAQPLVAQHLLSYFDLNPWDAGAVLWTLNLDQTPIYGLVPGGPFAATMFERLREAFREQTAGAIERVSVPGRIIGQARLFTGQVVPLIEPELRGFYSWTTSALIETVCGSAPPESASAENRQKHAEKTENVRRFLDRVYYELRNLGLTSQDRAINYAATNAFQIESIYEKSLKEAMDLDTIEVERSPICRPDSDCWDVVLAFFYPGRPQPSLRRLYRFTVDVSDIVPVLVGPVRNWYTR